MSGISGTVQSHTIIRVPGHVHAEAAPFVLLLVELDSGKRVLGHFAGDEPPLIGSRVSAASSHTTPIFYLLRETP
jgi:uncharacterized OB-fold protein